MDAAEQEAARANELTRLNASAKGFRTSFVGTRNTLMQALPLYRGGPTDSRRRTIDEALSKIGPQAEKVHDAYQRLAKLDDDERHLAVFNTRQQTNASSTTSTRTRTTYSEQLMVHSNVSTNSSLVKSKATSSRRRWLL
jgi:hypothetical protein